MEYRKYRSQPASKQASYERGEAPSSQQTEHTTQQESTAKKSRMPNRVIAFVQHAFASGADDKLDERLRLFLAHAVTKPHLTLQELAPLADVGTKERSRQLLQDGLLELWLGSPEELQERYPITGLLRKNRIRIRKPFSPEHRANLSKANMGKRHSPERRANTSEAMRRWWERKKKLKDAQVIFDANSQ